ncbi:MAG TPA: ester cyclase [Terracidiphilus sp.]
MRQFFEEVCNRKSEAAIDRMLAPDCIAYGLPDPDAVLRGTEEFRAFHRSFCGAFPDLYVTVEDVIAAGDRVAARWRATATHLGDHLGFPATGKKTCLDGATIGVIRNGRIAEAWNMMDMGYLFESLRSEKSRY